MDGQAVRKAREAARLSQEDLARLLGTSQSKLSRIERGLQAPDAVFVRSFSVAIAEISAQRIREMADALSSRSAA